MCLFSKRMDRGRFIWPSTKTGSVVMTAAQLSMLLEGIDWRRPERCCATIKVRTARQSSCESRGGVCRGEGRSTEGRKNNHRKRLSFWNVAFVDVTCTGGPPYN